MQASPNTITAMSAAAKHKPSLPDMQDGMSASMASAGAAFAPPGGCSGASYTLSTFLVMNCSPARD
jgi:hypothetical protein